MKKILITAICFLLLGSTTFVRAQFLTTHYYTGNSSLQSDYIQGGIAVDTNNNIWVGTDQGVAKFNGSTWTSYTISNGLPSDNIICITVDKYNNVWVGTDGDGIAKYNGSTWTTYTQHSTNNNVDSLCDNSIHYIAGDINGDVWFGSWGSGVSKLNGTTWTTYKTGLPLDGINTAAINYITVDASGNKWFGTNAGISKYNGSTFTNIDMSTIDSLPDNVIYSIAVDAANNKWIATQFGLTKLNSSNAWVKNYRKTDGLYNGFARDVITDPNGNLWLALYTDYNNDGGITKFDGTNFVSQQVDYPDTVSADQIFRLAVDKNKDVWAALDFGVLKIDHTSSIMKNQETGSFSIYPNPASDFINIDLSNVAIMKDQKLELYNSLEKVREFDVTDSRTLITIPVSDLSSGLYFVKLGNITRKIIIGR
jgi:ligand-binding sensor domain-containing protein